jgi:acetolactate synthase I/II/III large subunit
LFHAASDRLRQVTEPSDLVIGIGYDPVEYNYETWIPRVPLIHFGSSNVDMPPGMPFFSVLGEPDRWFGIMKDAAINGDLLSGRGVEKARREIADLAMECGSAWGPVSALKILREGVPRNTVLTCDVGSHLHMAGQYWPTEKPGMVVMTNGWSSMGFGIPSALAVKLNMPGTPVVCLTGDGGFLMTAGEMMTARRYNLNIKVVVISDRELNLIKVKQSWRNLDPYATSLLDGELFGSDIFLGIKVLHADDYVSMRQSISNAMSIDEPVIINVIVSGDDYSRLIVRQ